MKLIDQLRKKMELIGGTLDVSNPPASLYLDAPSGYIWRATGTPTLTIHYANNVGQTWLVQAIKSEREALLMGLTKVTDPKELEDIRWNNDDDNWGAPAEAPVRIDWPK